MLKAINPVLSALALTVATSALSGCVEDAKYNSSEENVAEGDVAKTTQTYYLFRRLHTKHHSEARSNEQSMQQLIVGGGVTLEGVIEGPGLEWGPVGPTLSRQVEMLMHGGGTFYRVVDVTNAICDGKEHTYTYPIHQTGFVLTYLCDTYTDGAGKVWEGYINGLTDIMFGCHAAPGA